MYEEKGNKDKIKIMHVAQAAGGVDRYLRTLLKYLDKSIIYLTILIRNK